VIPRYIFTSQTHKLRNNINVTDYFAGSNENISTSNSAAVKDIYVVDILGDKYRYHIDIGKGNIDPPLVSVTANLALCPSAGRCHLANLMASAQRHCTESFMMRAATIFP